MGEVVELFPQKVTTDEYFGGCPECGKCDGFLNVERNHWAVCDTHKTTWPIGANLFSSWHYETKADWERNVAVLRGYSVVTPVHYEPSEQERREAEENFDTWRRIDKGHGVVCGPDGIRALEPGEDDIPW